MMCQQKGQSHCQFVFIHRQRWKARLPGLLKYLPVQVTHWILTMQSFLVVKELETLIKRLQFWGNKWQISCSHLFKLNRSTVFITVWLTSEAGVVHITSAKKKMNIHVFKLRRSQWPFSTGIRKDPTLTWERSNSWNQPQGVNGIVMDRRSLPQLTYLWLGIKITPYNCLTIWTQSRMPAAINYCFSHRSLN